MIRSYILNKNFPDFLKTKYYTGGFLLLDGISCLISGKSNQGLS